MKLLAAFLADRRGASAVEFALVAGPLFMLLIGSLEYGRLLWLRQAVEETAIAGARCAGIMQPECAQDAAFDLGRTREFVIDNAAGRGVALEAGAITVDRSATCSGRPGFSRVSITYAFESALPPLVAGRSIEAEACFPNNS